MSDTTVLILNGPGLSSFDAFADPKLGITSLDDIRSLCQSRCNELGAQLDFRQSDDQNEVVRWIAQDANRFDALIFNPLGCIERTPIDYPRYCDELGVLANVTCTVTELHLTHVLRYDAGAFESLRGPQGNTALICGLGAEGYRVAINAAVETATEARA